ncbi:MAG: hypothetical protein HYX35_05635 [Proteobacteria bacterium]|nr:hypothetical protein [Pseudomonadota bacterium]
MIAFKRRAIEPTLDLEAFCSHLYEQLHELFRLHVLSQHPVLYQLVAYVRLVTYVDLVAFLGHLL